ncbi:hypothetical protein P7K49_007427 [Saguinus oedipus]|uniref:PX domain containing 1 n=1 Tax=Saguinus oedipus TaxID=9490 RepID=A0ABQ9VUU2_SAGOE|nr:hypothetical protein P7K49_007427 [Saguinus oedipus]
MASAVFEGTSLVNMFVRGCWVNGIRRLIVSRRGDEEEFFEIRTEWSDRSVLYLHRSLADLGRLWQRLRDAFPEDRPELARGPLRQGVGPGARGRGRGAEAAWKCTEEAGKRLHPRLRLLPPARRLGGDGGLLSLGAAPVEERNGSGKGRDPQGGRRTVPRTSHFRGGQGRPVLSSSQDRPGLSSLLGTSEGPAGGRSGKASGSS